MQDTYDIMSTGLQLNLVPPSSYIRVHDLEQSKQIYISNNIYLFIHLFVFLDLPYNEISGRGPTLNASTYILYGKISATIRSAPVGGAITAFIMIADEGDEIDFELLGGDTNHA
jgi:hypothetical protein